MILQCLSIDFGQRDAHMPMLMRDLEYRVWAGSPKGISSVIISITSESIISGSHSKSRDWALLRRLRVSERSSVTFISWQKQDEEIGFVSERFDKLKSKTTFHVHKSDYETADICEHAQIIGVFLKRLWRVDPQHFGLWMSLQACWLHYCLGVGL